MGLADLPELLTVREASDVLRCSERSVYRYVETGLLRAVKTPGKTLIPAASIRTFIDEYANARG